MVGWLQTNLELELVMEPYIGPATAIFAAFLALAVGLVIGRIAGWQSGHGLPAELSEFDEGVEGEVVRVDNYGLGGRQYLIVLDPMGKLPATQPKYIVVHGSSGKVSVDFAKGDRIKVVEGCIHRTAVRPGTGRTTPAMSFSD